MKAEVIKVKAETKTEILNLKSEVVKMKKELMTEARKEKKTVTSNGEAKLKEELARLESKMVAEMRLLKAEVAKAKSQPPECPICMQDMTPPTRIIMCQMGHKLCESCWMKPGLLSLWHSFHRETLGHGSFLATAHWEKLAELRFSR